MNAYFHLAIPVDDLKETISFYQKLGAKLGRQDDSFAVLRFFEHQVVLHVSPLDVVGTPKMYPRHFGMVFTDKNVFEDVYQIAKNNELPFFKERFHRFEGKSEEHQTFFLCDPSNNLIEFKWYLKEQFIFD